MECRNCGLPVAEMTDPWGGVHGWYHPTIEREVNIDGADVPTYATFCPDDLGEAEPKPEQLRHRDMVCGLRRLADFYEAHPAMPLPCLDIVNAFVNSKRELADAARQMSPCEKEADADWFSLKKQFGAIRLDVNIRRSQVCERIVTGTRHIEEKVIPAHEEEIVEWHCAESVLGGE